MAFIYDLTDTWNAGGTTFNAIRMNVTDTASAAASKLITLQVGGSERFGVRKDGQAFFAGNVGIGTASPRDPGAGYKGITLDGSTSGFLDLNTNGTRIFTMFGLTNDIALTNPTATGSMTFYTNNTERMRLDASGNVGIGTSPERRLHVVSNQPLRMGTATDWFQFTQTNTNVWGWLSSSSVYAMAMNGSTGVVSIATVTPNAAAQLQVDSTTRGFLPPRMTTTQRDAIATPPDGLMLYNSTTNKLQVRAAGAWVDLH